ncbi:MAG: hypothetical protein J6X67_08180 [Treponema sp.]|nr:hypothetical protein [Treponema sp.]
MEKVIDFFEKKVKLILSIGFAICLLHCIICISKGIYYKKALLFFGESVALYFIAWGMTFIVLGFQRINPFCPKSAFNFFCYLIIIISLVVIVYCFLNDTILCLIKENNEIEAMAFSTGPVGYIYGTIYLYKKNNNSEQKKEKEVETAETKKNKKIKYVIIFSIGLLLAISVCIFVFSSLSNCEPYKHSVEVIENNKEIIEYLGEDYKISKIVSGSISTSGNGTGEASISYTIKGKNGKSRVYVDAVKENGIWNYRKLIFYKEKGKVDSIDLLLIQE